MSDALPDHYAGEHHTVCARCGRDLAARYALTIESVAWRAYDGGDPLCTLCPGCDNALRAVINDWLNQKDS